MLFGMTVSVFYCSSVAHTISSVDISKMRLHEFINMTYNFESLWNFLCEKKVVRNEIKCPRCTNLLQIVDASENYMLHCTKKYYKVVRGRKRQRVTCNFKISALNGTWFERSHMDIIKICRFIAYFLMLQSPRHRFLMTELELNDHAIVDWTNFCREVSTTYCFCMLCLSMIKPMLYLFTKSFVVTSTMD